MAKFDASSTTANVSADEVAQFETRADAWWDPEGDFAPLHKINPARLQFVRDRLCDVFGLDFRAARPLAGLRLLDIGCGGGLLAEPLARLGATVTGIDAAEGSIRAAADHAAAVGLDIDYRCRLAEDLAGEEDRFDAVLSMEVVEHVPDPQLFVATCAALVAPGGVLVLATLNRTVKSLALAKIGAEYILRWLPRGTHDWRKFVRPSELAAHLRAAGMTLQTLSGVVYHPATDEWRLGDDVDVNYMAMARKPG